MVGRAPVLSCFAIRDVLGVLGSRRCDHANRRIFQSRFYGLMHSGAERPVHINVTELFGYFVVSDWYSHDDQPPSPSLNHRFKSWPNAVTPITLRCGRNGRKII